MKKTMSRILLWLLTLLLLSAPVTALAAGPGGEEPAPSEEDLMEEAQEVVDESVQNCLESNVNDWGKIKHVIRDSLSDFLWKKMKRSPMILPIIMEVDN